MSDRPQEPELRARFDELRSMDARRAPSFGDVMARAQAAVARESGAAPRREWRVFVRRYGWAGGLAAAAAIAALLVLPRVHSQENAFVQAVQSFESNPALGAWRSPTDGLLNLPGSRLISTVPSLGQQ